ncbi:MAG: type II toxin-antitoxin system VapC family toxin [Armatimonadota bacterium]|nr:type II toxin-antitoxin system VapC family toxin [Armatimonadota bacterium]
MSRYVLDSHAVLAFLQQERGWERVKDLITASSSGAVELYMSIINLAEVKYIVMRRKEHTPRVMAAIEALPVRILSADECIDQVIALKTRFAVSLADCFAAAAAIQLDCPLVTADSEFSKLEGVLQIEWLR